MKTTIFDGFDLNGVAYYFENGKYYMDNMTIRQVITDAQYRKALTDKLIKGD